jgi:hypothetical protein
MDNNPINLTDVLGDKVDGGKPNIFRRAWNTLTGKTSRGQQKQKVGSDTSIENETNDENSKIEKPKVTFENFRSRLAFYYSWAFSMSVRKKHREDLNQGKNIHYKYNSGSSVKLSNAKSEFDKNNEIYNYDFNPFSGIKENFENLPSWVKWSFEVVRIPVLTIKSVLKLGVGLISGLVISGFNLFVDTDFKVGWGLSDRVMFHNGNNFLGWGFGNYNKWTWYGVKLGKGYGNGSHIYPSENPGLIGLRIDGGIYPVQFVDILSELWGKRHSYYFHINLARAKIRRKQIRGEKIIDTKD